MGPRAHCPCLCPVCRLQGWGPSCPWTPSSVRGWPFPVPPVPGWLPPARSAQLAGRPTVFPSLGSDNSLLPPPLIRFHKTSPAASSGSVITPSFRFKETWVSPSVIQQDGSLRRAQGPRTPAGCRGLREASFSVLGKAAFLSFPCVFQKLQRALASWV